MALADLPVSTEYRASLSHAKQDSWKARSYHFHYTDSHEERCIILLMSSYVIIVLATLQKQSTVSILAVLSRCGPIYYSMLFIICPFGLHQSSSSPPASSIRILDRCPSSSCGHSPQQPSLLLYHVLMMICIVCKDNLLWLFGQNDIPRSLSDVDSLPVHVSHMARAHDRPSVSGRRWLSGI